MESFYRPTRVEVNLDALEHNVEAFRKALPEGTGLMAVVKANAYGHGAVQVAREAEALGLQYLGVALLDEALELRRAGITLPILVLGYTPPEGLELAARNDVTVNAFSREVLDALRERGGSRTGGEPVPPLKIHVKIDTGMGRLGLHDTNEAIAYIEEALRLPGVVVEGIFTHYACADESDKSYTLEQHAKFLRVVNHFRERGVTFPWVHAGNSATGFDTPELTFNMLRLGISLYGLYPSEEVRRERIALEPVMSLKSEIVHLKKLPPGSAISYGATYRTSGEETIATLPIGYADGFSRMLSGRAEALVRGRRVPIVGRICMDQCMVRVDDAPEAALHDEAVLFGSQGGERITVEEIAEKLGTVNYEIVCMISHRVPRIYIRGGRTVRIDNPLLGG